MPKKTIPVRTAGFPPVYIDVELGIPAGVSVKAAKAGKTRIVFESEYEFYSEMSYKKGSPIQITKDQKVTINDKKIEMKNKSTKIEAELFLKPLLSVRLYRVVGPYAYMKPYVRGEIEWPSTQKKDDLYMGVTGGVGIELSEPIFLRSIVSYDSGKIFDYDISWDLDGQGSQPFSPLQIDTNVKPDILVDRISPEGFVVLKLKEKKEDEFLRYELTEATQKGLLVPSENFFMDGELYYYPQPGGQSDHFKVEISSNGGRKKEVEVRVEASRALKF